jgi:hypothetical protein
MKTSLINFSKKIKVKEPDVKTLVVENPNTPKKIGVKFSVCSGDE